MDILLEQEAVRLPARQADAAGRDIQEHNGLIGKIKVPFQYIIIKAKELVVDFLGHMDDFDIEARADMDLVEDIDQIIGLTNSRRRQDSDILDIVIAKELAEPQQDLTDFIQRLKTDMMALEYRFPIFHFSGYIFDDFHVVQRRISNDLQGHVDRPDMDDTENIPGLFFHYSPHFS